MPTIDDKRLTAVEGAEVKAEVCQVTIAGGFIAVRSGISRIQLREYWLKKKKAFPDHPPDNPPCSSASSATGNRHFNQEISRRSVGSGPPGLRRPVCTIRVLETIINRCSGYRAELGDFSRSTSVSKDAGRAWAIWLYSGPERKR